VKALVRATLFDFETFRPDSYLLFDETIAASGPMAEFPGADEVTDVAGAWVMPGLVVGHSHLYSTFARGWVTPFAPHNFTQLLEQLWWKLDAGLDLEAVAFSGRVGALASLKAGVTTLVDHHASGVIRGSLAALRNAVVEETGLRGIFAFETSDRFDVEACLEENRAFARHPGARSAGMLGLHAGLTLSDATLDRIAETTEGLPVHVHLAEAPEDRGTAARLNARGLWRPGSLAVHGVHLEPGEAALLASQGVTLALNPSSNLSNGVGLPHLGELRREKVRVTLGTDGLGFSLGPEVRNLVFSQRHRALDPLAAGLDDVVALLRATWDFAGEALGCQLGRIEPGYEADLVAVDYHPPTPLDAGNAVGHWFYGLLEDWRPKAVWVGGVPRLVAHKPLVAEAELHREARRVAEALWKRIS
jgi:cytosine/adenosine deaminase-related metal-dependent hydrolase